MFLTMFLTMISFIMRIFFTLWTGKLDPAYEVTEQIIQNVGAIMTVASQGINFVYFMVGDTLPILIPILIATLIFKYLVYPIVDFVRRLIPFVNL